MSIHPKNFCGACGHELTMQERLENECWNCVARQIEDMNSDDDFEEDEYEEEDWQPCSDCDGNDACFDFGCALKLGLDMLLPQPL